MVSVNDKVNIELQLEVMEKNRLKINKFKVEFLEVKFKNKVG